MRTIYLERNDWECVMKMLSCGDLLLHLGATMRTIWFYSCYHRSTNFCGYIFSQILRFLAIFAKLNTREIFLDVKFAKIDTCEFFYSWKSQKLIPAKKATLSGREDKEENLQNTTYVFPKPNRLQLYHIVCFSVISKKVSILLEYVF